MQTIMDRQQKWLVRRFHTICTKLQLSPDEKREIIHAYGCLSSADMSSDDLVDVCYKLEMTLDPKLAELDRWRKRVMKSIAVYLEIVDKKPTAELIKGIACRASSSSDFNKITLEQLRNLYSAFTKKNKIFKDSWKEMEDLLCSKK